ncbi:hypothetical protein QJS04_geneDACA005124 [Acorus gramineus]|uniref:Uncharacterized protein n=1 Tax=Acorus gramineus TaxID=55184 RepID=A0AAV9AWT0_ACOGR|nr:hypothetical protein QJS04_geneDACA005124 [Acorus gramineus]
MSHTHTKSECDARKQHLSKLTKSISQPNLNKKASITFFLTKKITPLPTSSLFFSMEGSNNRRGYQRLLRQFSYDSSEFDHIELPLKPTKDHEPMVVTLGGRNDVHATPPPAPPRMRQPSKSSGGAAKSHPLFNLMDAPKKKGKKATAKPELVRYMEYMKEAGTWDPNSNRPVIYFK